MTNAASVRDFVPVQAILPGPPGDGALVVLRDGSFRLLIRCGRLNTDMMSDREAEAIYAAFRAMIDSLDYHGPIQFQQHTRLLDADAYARQFAPFLSGDRLTPQLRALCEARLRHYSQLVSGNELLQRETFLVLSSRGSMKPELEKTTDELPMARIWKAFGAGRAIGRDNQKEPSAQEIMNARNDLSLRAEELESRLHAIGIWTERLEEEELKDLLYELFHPALRQGRRNISQASSGAIGPQRSAPQAPQQTPAPERRQLNPGQAGEDDGPATFERRGGR